MTSIRARLYYYRGVQALYPLRDGGGGYIHRRCYYLSLLVSTFLFSLTNRFRLAYPLLFDVPPRGQAGYGFRGPETNKTKKARTP